MIKKHWRTISFIYLILTYFIFINIFNSDKNTLLLAYFIFLLITVILFLGTLIGIFGTVVHSISRNDAIAEKFYRIAKKFKTKNITVLGNYGLILLKQNKPEDAMTLFIEALSYNKGFLSEKSLRANIAICYWKMNEIDKAIEEYEMLLSEYSFSDNNIEQNEENTDKIIASNPYFFALDYTTLGYLYLLKNDLEKSEFITNLALRRNDLFAPALDNLGQIYFTKKDYAKAKNHFITALEINSNMSDSNYYLGLIYKEEKNIEKAKEYLEKALNCTINGLSSVTENDIKNELAKLTYTN